MRFDSRLPRRRRGYVLAFLAALLAAACGGGNSPSTASTSITSAASLDDKSAHATIADADDDDAHSNAEPEAAGAATIPKITKQPVSRLIKVGSAATFSVKAAGAKPLTYQWLRDGVVIPGADKPSFRFSPLDESDSGARLTVVVGNALGSVESHGAIVAVNTILKPSSSVLPVATSVVEGERATFTVLAEGVGPLKYQWYRNGLPIAGATRSTYVTPPTDSATNNGVFYSVFVQNSAGSVGTVGARLTTTPKVVRPTLTQQPKAAAAVIGQTATFSVAADGSAPLRYQWRKDGVAIPNATESSFTTGALIASDDKALYDVIVRNASKTVATSHAAKLTVQKTWTGIRQDNAPYSGGLGSTASNAVSTDAKGNVIIGGTTGNSFDLERSGTTWSFIAKYSAAGALLWGRHVLDESNGVNVSETIKGVAADAKGNIFVVGETLTTLPGEVAAGNIDVFIAKFDGDGRRLWAHQLGSSAADFAGGVAVDSNGDAFIVGSTFGQLPQQNAPVQKDYFVAKYASNGKRLWLHQGDWTPEDPVSDDASAVAVDTAGNAYVAGSRNQTSIEVAKYSGAGALVWTGTLAAHDSTNPQYAEPMRANGVAVSDDGNTIYVSGWTYADFDAVNNPPVASFCCTQGDAFVARFDRHGALAWAHNLSSQTLSGDRRFDDEAFAVTTDAKGSAAYVAGYTKGTMPGAASQGDNDLFVARFDASGRRRWVRQFGAGLPASGTRNDAAHGITMDRRGSLFVTGVTHGSFGTPTHSTAADDWFVMKLRPSSGAAY